MLDSGATSHMLKDTKWFTPICRSDGRTVTVADSSTFSCTGVRTARLIFDESLNTIVLRKTLLVPNLHQNLLSVAALRDDGSTIDFGREECIISKQGAVVGRAQCRGGVYAVPLFATTATISATSAKVSNLELWHHRLGRVNRDVIERMAKDDVFAGFDLHRTVQAEKVCGE